LEAFITRFASLLRHSSTKRGLSAYDSSPALFFRKENLNASSWS